MIGRREFLRGIVVAGGAGLLDVASRPAAAEPPPETTRLRIAESPAICFAPIYVAREALLPAEGFTEVQSVRAAAAQEPLIAGEADIGATDIASIVVHIDRGRPLVMLSGLHAGCYELFGGDRVRAIRDLRGKSVAIPGLHSGRHLMLSAMLAHVGIDPGKEINWITHPAAESMQLLAEGKVDAYMGFPPEPQELRAKKIGRLVVSTTVDRPWSQYFCCVVVANREFVRKHPIAAKRALRAILKAAHVCASDPTSAARILVDRGLTTHFEYARQMLVELPYSRWRGYDPADTMRFYALRLHEAGLIRTAPPKIVSQGSDWRFLNELKKELKG
jgi:NitT/TauT family transport system substrate-binding protein